MDQTIVNLIFTGNSLIWSYTKELVVISQSVWVEFAHHAISLFFSLYILSFSYASFKTLQALEIIDCTDSLLQHSRDSFFSLPKKSYAPAPTIDDRVSQKPVYMVMYPNEY